LILAEINKESDYPLQHANPSAWQSALAPFNIYSMIKFNKFFLAFTFVALSSVLAVAQFSERNISESALLNRKFTKEQVWDAQRKPAFPSAGKDWELSNLKGAYDIGTKSALDWGRSGDRYLMFVLEPDRFSFPESLKDNESGRKYCLSLRQFEHDGHLVKVISRWGKLIGIGTAGFLYEQEGRFGTLFSMDRRRSGEKFSYRTEVAQVENLSQVLKERKDERRPEMREEKKEERREERRDDFKDDRRAERAREYYRAHDSRSDFLNRKYTYEDVWDAQRSPAFPIAGRDWKLSNLKAPYDVSNNSMLDWGRNRERYLMFDLEEDHSNHGGTLTDDEHRSGKKYNVALNLFDRDGRFVKTVSRWGKLMGFGSGGFMYEQEDRLGTYFTTETIRTGGSLIYRPEIDQIRNLSSILGDDRKLGNFSHHRH